MDSRIDARSGPCIFESTIMNICWFENIVLMFISISLKPLSLLKWTCHWLHTPGRGTKGKRVESPQPQWKQSPPASLLTVAVRVHWHAVIRDGEAQFQRTCSIISASQQRAAKRTKAIVCLLPENCSWQQTCLLSALSQCSPSCAAQICCHQGDSHPHSDWVEG